MLNQTQHHRVRLYVPGDPRHTRRLPRPQTIPQEITVAEVHHHHSHHQQRGDQRAAGQKWREERREGNMMIPSKHSSQVTFKEHSQVTFKEDEKIVTWKAQRKK